MGESPPPTPAPVERHVGVGRGGRQAGVGGAQAARPPPQRQVSSRRQAAATVGRRQHPGQVQVQQ